MRNLLSARAELLESGNLVSSAGDAMNWEDGAGSKSMKFSIKGAQGGSNLFVEITAKPRPDDAIGGFVRINSPSEDLALWSYFCRLWITESMGVRVEGGTWFRLFLSNGQQAEGPGLFQRGR
jgi:hypothetical protein